MASIESAACVTDLREALRHATRERHSAVARVASMRRLFADDYTLDEYRLHIARLFGFFEPLERSIDRAPAPGIEERGFARTPALSFDLTTMGYHVSDIRALDRCTTLPTLTSNNVYGCCYVLLGSSLGGRIIAERLRRNLGARASLRFYGDGNNESDERWALFCAELQRPRNADVAAICAAASATFGAYATWLSDEPPTDRRAISR